LPPSKALINPRVAISAAIQRAAQAVCPEPISLREFVLKAWKVIEPATPLQLNWHHELILEHLEAAFNRQVTRLVINIPPRELKSILSSVLWPDWCWTRAPWTRWVFTSYSLSLSTEFSVKRRRILRDEWYQRHWGRSVKLADDQDLKTEFENLQTGKMTATSTGGTLTGKGGDFIVMDDPQNPQMAESEAERKQTNDFYSNTLLSRLNDKRLGVIVLIQQRLHADDTTSLVLKEGGWEHVCIQAMASQRKAYSFPVSNRVIELAEGDLIQSSRSGLAEFNQMRKAMGSRTHDAQYQQQPTAEQGNIFKRHWWRFYKDAPTKFDFVIQSWDLTFKDTTDSAYVSGQVWGVLGSNKYLLDEVHAKLDYPGTKRAMLSLRDKWPSTNVTLIEDKANGPAIIADLKGTVPGLIAVTPNGDKVVRAVAVTSTVEAGDCWLPSPESAPWVTEFVSEVAAFPEAKLKDRVDAMSQALSRMNDLGKLLAEAREAQASNDKSNDSDTEEMGISNLMNSETEVFSSAGSF
jgi:predicted phage terminase large subunit-like protein